MTSCRVRRPWRGLVALAVVWSAAVVAQSPAAAAEAALRPFLRAVATAAPPQLDGLGGDAVWQEALSAGPWVSLDGSSPAEEPTAAMVAHDAESLYLLVVCSESLLNPMLQRTHEVKAEAVDADGAVFADDCIEVFIQPGVEATPYFHLAVNPRGTLYDARCVDGTYDTAWSSQARVTATADTTAWTVEVAVPLAALGGAPAADATWGFNLARRRHSTGTWSCWSPTGGSLHTPSRFGTLAFQGPPASLTAPQAPGFEEGPQRWQFMVRSAQPLQATALIRHGDFPWQALTSPIEPSAEAQRRRLEAVLTRANTAIWLNAPPEQAAATLCFRTDRLPVRGGTTYRFAARVRAEGLTGGGRPLVFSVSSYDAAGAVLQTYQSILAIPEGTYDWRDVEAEWQAPEAAAEILFWVVKWGGSGVSGQVWLDDLRLLRPDSPVNVLPNGAVAVNAEGSTFGWNLFTGSRAQPSYDHGALAEQACEIRDADGRLLWRAGPFAGEVVARVTAISAVPMLTASMGDSDSTLRLKDLHVKEGGVLTLPVVLRSSEPRRYGWADVVLEVPEQLHLISPEPRAAILERRLEAGRRSYRVRFGGEAISPMDGTKAEQQVHYLLLECGLLPAAPTAPLLLRLGGAVEGVAEELLEMPVHVLPPLTWRRPEQVLIKNWACSSFYRPFHQLNAAEQAAVARLWRQAGFNRAGPSLPEALRDRHGFLAQGHIPLTTAGGNFPGGAEYLEAHPEAQAMTFAGQVRAGTFCPTYFLSDANGHLAEVAAWLGEQARRYPQLDWDYEVPVLRDGSICACDRCLEAFRQAHGLADPAAVNRETVRQTHRREWVAWRCRENARLAEVFRRHIKAANPDCLFSIYSGYQGDTDEKYGVDWRSMAVPADLVWAGYGRPVAAIQATHEAIAGRPFVCGLLAWYGSHPWNNQGAQIDLLRRLTDGGNGVMSYFNWVVDGRFYRGVSRAAAVAADFEAAFQWSTGADGTTRSHYERADDLVEVGGEGLPEDVTVLRSGADRLLFVFNATAGDRVFELRHRDWREGMACIDLESKEIFGESLSITVPSREVRLLHLRAPGPVEVAAPRVLSAQDGEPAGAVLLAWQGQGSHPGDQVFDLQTSGTAAFAPAATTTTEGLTGTVFAWRQIAPGETAYWRVRGRDPITGAAGGWSEAVRVVRGGFAEPALAPAAFSPNGDGQLDDARITAEMASDQPWTVRILDAAGAVRREIAGEGRLVDVVWDGRDGAGQVLPTGTYRFEVVPAGAAALASGGNLDINPRVGLPNPGLDRCQGFALTIPRGRGRLLRDYDTSATGSYSLALRSEAPGTDAYWSNYAAGGLGSPPMLVTPGKAYRFAAQVRTDLRGGQASLALTFFTADGRWAGVPGHKASGVPSEPVTGQQDWTRRELVLTAPPGAFAAVLFFRVEKADGTAWFDDVAFEEVPGPR
ncbi:MAG: hypothetical protein GX595_16495 [Lentisphaerae bacterium]|nr:hypothetical protein [Lentisphaerota bacterium]